VFNAAGCSRVQKAQIENADVVAVCDVSTGSKNLKNTDAAEAALKQKVEK
jgi:hypothetical protein